MQNIKIISGTDIGELRRDLDKTPTGRALLAIPDHGQLNSPETNNLGA